MHLLTLASYQKKKEIWDTMTVPTLKLYLKLGGRTYEQMKADFDECGVGGLSLVKLRKLAKVGKITYSQSDNRWYNNPSPITT